MESKQRTPSVIARLMGLDELPPQQPVQKQQRVLSENYQRRVASIGIREKRSSHERSSFRMSIEEQQEMKDIFEVLESLKRDKNCNLSVEKGKINSTLSETTRAIVSQKFIDAEHLSVDKKLQNLNEFHGAVEVIDSNKDLFSKHLQGPDSLFTKHLHDLQGAYNHLQSGHISKSSYASDCRNKSISAGRITEHGNAELLLKLENSLLTDSCGEGGLDNSHNLIRSKLELKDELCPPPPTSIVVLKPKLGKVENAARYFSSPRPYKGTHSGDRKSKDFLAVKNGKLYDEVQESKKLADDMESVSYRSRVSKAITKEITRQMRHDVSNNFVEILKLRIRGGDSLAKDSEVAMHASPSFFNGKTRYQSLKSFSDGSYMAGEAKKKVLEQRKMTKRFQEVGLTSNSSTLSEMLAMPDNEERPRNLDYKPGKHGQSNCNGPSDEDANLGSSMGISSRDGWKDECVGNKQRFRYFPPSTAIRSPKTGTRFKALQNDLYWRPGDSVNLVQPESRWQNVNQKDGSKSKTSRFRCNKSESFPSLESENSHSVKETGAILDKLKNKLEERDPSELYSTVSKSSTCCISCSDPEYNHTMKEPSVISDELKNKFEDVDQSNQKSMVPKSSTVSVDSACMAADVVTHAETEVAGRSFQYPEKKLSEPTACILFPKDAGSSSLVRQESTTEFPEEGSVSSHCSGSDPESLMCLGAAYQPSPDSVLEPVFKDEFSSSSEFFESTGADPHGLLMKLQLLKSESSEAYSEGPGMIISSDDDSGEGSVCLSEENDDLMRLFRVEESRDFSYTVDVLTEAGFHGRNLDMGFDKWHSPECPISPSAFETLEKKYGEQTSWKRSERRLLFDRINSGLLEILQPCMGVPTWAKPVAKRVSSVQRWEVEEELWMLLVSLEKEVSKNSSEKVLGREFGSLELRDDIEVIGREVERLLIDDLVAEVVSM